MFRRIVGYTPCVAPTAPRELAACVTLRRDTHTNQNPRHYPQERKCENEFVD